MQKHRSSFWVNGENCQGFSLNKEKMFCRLSVGVASSSPYYSFLEEAFESFISLKNKNIRIEWDGVLAIDYCGQPFYSNPQCAKHGLFPLQVAKVLKQWWCPSCQMQCFIMDVCKPTCVVTDGTSIFSFLNVGLMFEIKFIQESRCKISSLYAWHSLSLAIQI